MYAYECAMLLNIIPHLRNVRLLDLDYNYLRQADVSALKGILKSLHSLTALILRRYNLYYHPAQKTLCMSVIQDLPSSLKVLTFS